MNATEKLLYKRAYAAARQGRPIDSFTDEVAASETGVNSLSAMRITIDAYAAQARGVPLAAAVAMLQMERAACWRRAATQVQTGARDSQQQAGYKWLLGVFAALFTASLIAANVLAPG